MHGAQDTGTGGFVGAHLGATDVTGKPSLPSALLQTQRAQHAARLGAGFVEFVPRLGVGDDAGAGAEAKLRTLDLRAADQDVQVQVAVAVQPAHRAGVGAAADALQFGDDLHAAHLGAAGDGAAGEHGADHAAGRGVGAQAPAHVADDVVHVRVAFHAHQFVDLDAAGHAYAAQVVALQVDQHHVLGALLGVADQLADAGAVVVAVETRARARDGARFHHVAAHRDQALGRRTDHRPAVPHEPPGEPRGGGFSPATVQAPRA